MIDSELVPIFNELHLVNPNSLHTLHVNEVLDVIRDLSPYPPHRTEGLISSILTNQDANPRQRLNDWAWTLSQGEEFRREFRSTAKFCA